MKESDVQKKIIDYLHSVGAWTVKVIKANKNGVPDIIACLDGRFIALEVKRDEAARKKSDKEQPLQTRQIKQIIRSGGIAAKVISVDEVKGLINVTNRD